MAELRVTTSRRLGLWPIPFRGGDGVWWMRLLRVDVEWFWSWNSDNGWIKHWDNETG